MKKVLFDCDNTMGLDEKDVDDGLALLYLLGREDVELQGVTSVFGNGTLAEANQVTNQMLAELEETSLSVHSGAVDKDDLDTDAASFLVEEAKRLAGDVTFLATGPLTNLKAAYELDNNFFSYLKEIVVMGGITETLCFNGKEVEELNFSCDPEATKLVLEAEVSVTVATGNLCLDALFSSKEWNRIQNSDLEVYQYIYNYISHWYKYGVELIGEEGFYMWDLVSALYVTSPELYVDKYYTLQSTADDLTTGRLILKRAASSQEENKAVINIPTRIKDIAKFKNLVFGAWANI
ncbi:nucleoside hydrolase [Halanaerocella petrolearia]